MPTPFVGRETELALLHKRLARVTADGAGAAVAIRGRRQVGKSRLVQEFCDRAGRPYVFFSATKGASPVESIADFMTELSESSLPADRELVPRTAPTNWPDALRTLAALLPDSPSVVVLDELPWLAEQDPVFDGALQTAWDRLLSGRPVLLLLLGSDLHMMERFTAYDRPFYGRADSLVLGPLNPAETGDALGLEAADAIDAHLVSGGLPGILRAWPHGTPALDFIKSECADPASPLFGVPEAALMAELPAPDQSRRVLEAVGSGDRTHANIAATAGSQSGALPSGILSPCSAASPRRSGSSPRTRLSPPSPANPPSTVWPTATCASIWLPRAPRRSCPDAVVPKPRTAWWSGGGRPGGAVLSSP